MGFESENPFLFFSFFGFSFKRTILGRDGEKMGLKRNLEKMGEVGNFWDFSSRIFKRRGGVGGGGIYTKKIGEERESQGLAAWFDPYPLLFLFSNFQAAIWRYMKPWISSNLVFLQRYGCLVFIASNFMQFGATIVEIVHSEGR